MEFRNGRASEPTGIAEFARRSEAQGWDGIGLGDYQSLTGDPHMCLAVAATVTGRLGLATSVTNPVTRHVSVTATSAIAVQLLSRGRMVPGMGRGDSAPAHSGITKFGIIGTDFVRPTAGAEAAAARFAEDELPRLRG